MIAHHPLFPMDLSQLERRVRLLSAYAAGTSALLALLTLAVLTGAAAPDEPTRFDVLQAQRIEVVEPDGRIALVIANTERLPGVMIRGEERTEREGAAGMLFYNAEGSEAGGLIFGSEVTDSTFRAFEHLSFDQYNQDQVLTFSYSENDERRSAALRVVDRSDRYTMEDLIETIDRSREGTPEEQEAANAWFREHIGSGRDWGERVVLGSIDRTALLSLHDRRGRVRIRLSVDSLDVARLEFLDDEGAVIHALPE